MFCHGLFTFLEVCVFANSKTKGVATSESNNISLPYR